MTTPDEIQQNARKVLYLMVMVQRLRVGEGMAPAALKRDLDAHGMGEQDQTLAIDYACDKGWLQFGPDEEVQITDKGFALDWGQ